MKVEVGQLLLARVACMVMVHWIIAHGDVGPIQRLRLFIRVGHVVKREAHLSVNASRLAMVRHEGQTVGSRIFVISQRKSVESQLMLHEIDKPHGVRLRLSYRFVALLWRHVDHVCIKVVTLDGPVNHIFSSRHLAISDHLVLRPLAVRLLRRDTLVVYAAASKIVGVISLRFFHGHVAPIIFQYRHIGKVLHNVVCLCRSNVFVRNSLALHAHIIRHATHLGDISQLSSVDKHLSLNGVRLSVGSCHMDSPHVAVMAHRLNLRPGPQRHALFLCHHVVEDAVAHRRFKHHVAHPPRFQGFKRTVMSSKTVAKLAPQTSRHVIVAIHGPNASRREHASQPCGLFNDHHTCP